MSSDFYEIWYVIKLNLLPSQTDFFMNSSKRRHGNACYSEHVQFAARCEKRRARVSK